MQLDCAVAPFRITNLEKLLRNISIVFLAMLAIFSCACKMCYPLPAARAYQPSYVSKMFLSALAAAHFPPTGQQQHGGRWQGRCACHRSKQRRYRPDEYKLICIAYVSKHPEFYFQLTKSYIIMSWVWINIRITYKAKEQLVDTFIDTHVRCSCLPTVIMKWSRLQAYSERSTATEAIWLHQKSRYLSIDNQTIPQWLKLRCLNNIQLWWFQRTRRTRLQ